MKIGKKRKKRKRNAVRKRAVSNEKMLCRGMFVCARVGLPITAVGFFKLCI